jgi:hypothetical protein
MALTMALDRAQHCAEPASLSAGLKAAGEADNPEMFNT